MTVDPREMTTEEICRDAHEDALALRDMAQVIAHPVVGPMTAKAVPATARAVADTLDELARRLLAAESQRDAAIARAEMLGVRLLMATSAMKAWDECLADADGSFGIAEVREAIHATLAAIQALAATATTEKEDGR